MSFWHSAMGELTGKAEDAFAKIFKTIPDNTTALAKIEKFVLDEHNGKRQYEINWVLTSGDYRGQHVFQKIHAFDPDPKKRHRALNMLMLIYTMFNMKPIDSNPPQNAELLAFVGKTAGIKIQEWSMQKEDGSGLLEGNFVSEVHPAMGFRSETGVKLEVTHQFPVESALTRNARRMADAAASDDLLNDVPF